jgi:hypothetical protein
MEVETLVEWTLRRLEELTRNLADESFDRHVTHSPPVKAIPTNADQQLYAHGLSGSESAVEDKLYDTFVKMRDLLEQYAPTR